jgi:hypothetical protein
MARNIMNKLYVLQITNKGTEDPSAARAYAADYIKKQCFQYGTDAEVEYSYAAVDLKNLSYKSFGVFNENDNLRNKELFGIDGIKDILRNQNIIPNNIYHIIQFIYEPTHKDTAFWTYPNELKGAIFQEFPIKMDYLSDLSEIYVHEFCHAFYRMLWGSSIYLQDTLDSVTGTRRDLINVNYQNISPYWDLITRTPIGRQVSYFILQTAQWIKNKLMNISTSNKIAKMAIAIESYEGYYEPGQNNHFPQGSLSYLNCNPGNFRYNSFVDEYLGGKPGLSGFAKWNKYKDGLGALITFITWAAQGKMHNYRPDMTIIDFFKTYAPSSDGNEPNAYANFVAKMVGVSPQEQIKNLLQ